MPSFCILLNLLTGAVGKLKQNGILGSVMVRFGLYRVSFVARSNKMKSLKLGLLVWCIAILNGNAAFAVQVGDTELTLAEPPEYVGETVYGKNTWIFLVDTRIFVSSSPHSTQNPHPTGLHP